MKDKKEEESGQWERKGEVICTALTRNWRVEEREDVQLDRNRQRRGTLHTIGRCLVGR